MALRASRFSDGMRCTRLHSKPPRAQVNVCNRDVTSTIDIVSGLPTIQPQRACWRMTVTRDSHPRVEPTVLRLRIQEHAHFIEVLAPSTCSGTIDGG